TSSRHDSSPMSRPSCVCGPAMVTMWRRCRRGSISRRRVPRCLLRPWSARTGHSTRCCFIRRWCIPTTDSRSCATSPTGPADATDLFLDRLKGITDPEQKRKVIGAAFIDVFETRARELGEFEFLAQGTLYPDVIESAGVHGPAVVIKSHHNVGGLPERMRFTL